jgi:cysteine desulfurase / selenocysteine lyase
MTTSEPGKGVPPGILDPDVLARMANEFFTALPEFVPVAEGVLAEAQRGAPAPSFPTNVASVPTAGVPTETELRVLPANSPIPPVQAQVPAIPGTAIPEIPGGVAETRYGGTSSFSFLDEIRPIFLSNRYAIAGRTAGFDDKYSDGDGAASPCKQLRKLEHAAHA